MTRASKEQLLVKKARDILVKHKGEKNAIFSREMSMILGIHDGDTFIKTRSVIDKAVRRYGLPVAATTAKGYFFITSKEELFDYMGTLEGRKMEIQKKKELVFENYIEHYGALEPTEETE